MEYPKIKKIIKVQGIDDLLFLDNKGETWALSKDGNNKYTEKAKLDDFAISGGGGGDESLSINNVSTDMCDTSVGNMYIDINCSITNPAGQINIEYSLDQQNWTTIWENANDGDNLHVLAGDDGQTIYYRLLSINTQAVSNTFEALIGVCDVTSITFTDFAPIVGVTASYFSAYELNEGALDVGLQISDDGVTNWGGLSNFSPLGRNGFTGSNTTVAGASPTNGKYYRLRCKDQNGADVYSNTFQFFNNPTTVVLNDITVDMGGNSSFNFTANNIYEYNVGQLDVKFEGSFDNLDFFDLFGTPTISGIPTSPLTSGSFDFAVFGSAPASGVYVRITVKNELGGEVVSNSVQYIQATSAFINAITDGVMDVDMVNAYGFSDQYIIQQSDDGINNWGTWQSVASEPEPYTGGKQITISPINSGKYYRIYVSRINGEIIYSNIVQYFARMNINSISALGTGMDITFINVYSEGDNPPYTFSVKYQISDIGVDFDFVDLDYFEIPSSPYSNATLQQVLPTGCVDQKYYRLKAKNDVGELVYSNVKQYIAP